MRNSQPLPYPLELVTGAIGKQFVVKRTPWGKIITKYPDMSRIIATAGQRKCRNIFKEAVAYAKSIIADSKQKAAWQKRLKRRNGVYNAAVSYYMKKEKLSGERNQLLTEKLIRQAMNGTAAIAVTPSNIVERKEVMPVELYHLHPNNNKQFTSKIRQTSYGKLNANHSKKVCS